MPLLFTLLVLSQTALPDTILIPAPGIGVSSNLATHLELTEEQVSKIRDLQANSSNFQSRQTQKQLELQAAITVETAKASPDPFIIGTHYVELETIKRNLAKERTNVMNRIHELLTEPQKASLAQLSHVLSVYPLACEAANANMIVTPASTSSNVFTSRSIPPSAIPSTPTPIFAGVSFFSMMMLTPCEPTLQIPRGILDFSITTPSN